MITKVQAIKKVLEEFGGKATWQQIYDNIEKYYPSIKSSKAWKEGIRGVLYREIKKGKNFKKIGIGIFALKEYEEEPIPKKKDKIRMHSFMEGICLELGNLHNFLTYTPDKTSVFKEGIYLSQISTLHDIPPFTYPEIIEDVKKIDVIWFNKEKLVFPEKVFEVVRSSNTLSEALNRCLQLLPFNVKFYIIGPKEYSKKFYSKIEKKPYEAFKERFLFRDYDTMIDFYEHAVKYEKLKKGVLIL